MSHPPPWDNFLASLSSGVGQLKASLHLLHCREPRVGHARLRSRGVGQASGGMGHFVVVHCSSLLAVRLQTLKSVRRPKKVSYVVRRNSSTREPSALRSRCSPKTYSYSLTREGSPGGGLSVWVGLSKHGTRRPASEQVTICSRGLPSGTITPQDYSQFAG